jgi:hypothetical protein
MQAVDLARRVREILCRPIRSAISNAEKQKSGAVEDQPRPIMPP